MFFARYVVSSFTLSDSSDSSQTKVRPEEHKCNLALLNGTTVLNYDILNLAALTVLCITGPQKDDILDQRGTQADELVEFFHDVSHVLKAVKWSE